MPVEYSVMTPKVVIFATAPVLPGVWVFGCRVNHRSPFTPTGRPPVIHDGLDDATGSGYSAMRPIDGLAPADALPDTARTAATQPVTYNLASKVDRVRARPVWAPPTRPIIRIFMMGNLARRAKVPCRGSPS
jgi:hypothetical protein